MEILLTHHKQFSAKVFILAFLMIVFTCISVPQWADAATSISKPANNLGLVGYWPMNEATSTQMGDFSGNGNTGTVTLTGVSWVNGKIGNALKSTVDPPVTVANSTSINLSGTTTIAFWIKGTTATAAFSDIISKLDYPNTGYSIQNTDATPDFKSLAIFIYTSAGAAQWCATGNGITGALDGSWHQVVFVVSNSTTGTCAMYKDGALIDTGGYNHGGGLAAPTASLTMGIDNAKLGPTTLDDLRIYNRALSATEVAALYKGGTAGAVRGNASSATLTSNTTLNQNLVGLWTFDGGSTNWTSASAGVTYDRSGNNSIGTLTNMSQINSPVIGKLGQAFLFDGADDIVNAGTASTLDNIGNGANGNGFTISAWINPTTTGEGGFGRIAQKGTGVTSDLPVNGWAFYMFTGNGLKFASDAASSHLERIGNASSVTLNVWQHVAVTWDGVITTAASVHIYVNGVEIGYQTSTNGIGARADDNSANFLAGNEPGGTFAFNGSIDDVRAYNRALSLTEIKQLYRLGAAKIR